MFPLIAQGDLSPPPPQERPGWYGRTERLNNPTASERAIIDRNLTAAERLITSTTGYAQPRGFEGRPHWASSPPQVAGGLRTYSVQIGVFVPDWRRSGLNPYARIFFNPELGQVSDGGLENETGEYYFHERPRSPPAYGTTFVYGKFGVPNSSLLVLLTAHDQDPMLPVSREQYLRARIHELDDGKSRAVPAFDPAARLREQLAAMTPQERASQAWAGGTDLMPEGAPGALRVVRANPAFFRARGSAADARAILVILREPPPALATAQDLLHRELDWAALRRLLDTRP